MHRTLGENFDPDVYSDASNKTGYQPGVIPTLPATRLPYSDMNAIQEELSNFIESRGITLSADGDADKIDGWEQLTEAIGNVLTEARNYADTQDIINYRTKSTGVVSSVGVVSALTTTVPTPGTYRISFSALAGMSIGDAITTSLDIKTGSTIQNSLTPAQNNRNNTSSAEIYYSKIVDISGGEEIITINVTTLDSANILSNNRLTVEQLPNHVFQASW